MLLLDDISIAYDQLSVVSQLSFQLKEGQIGCLMGPSGCGKSTVLKLIAGFLKPYQGRFFLRDQWVGDQQPAFIRKVGLVFQDFALFPHLTVLENVVFGLHKWSSYERQARAKSLMVCLAIKGLENYYPHQLSGGQQQRVAIARAIAPKPDLVLLDEPFSSLDAELSSQLLSELKNLIREEGITSLMVTHDQQQAFAFADVMGVIQGGKLHQWGSAYDLYHRPKTRFVADFIGEGVFIPGHVETPNHIKTALGVFEDKNSRIANGEATIGSALDVLIRPDDIIHDDNSMFQAAIVDRVFRGTHFMYYLALDDEPTHVMLCLAPSHHNHSIGDLFGFRVDLQHLIAFPT